MNQQAATIAASVLGERVEAATRCEHLRFETLERKAMFTGGTYTPYKRHTALPRSFILAVTGTRVHVLEEERVGDELVGGKVVRSWDRQNFELQLHQEVGNVVHKIPDDQRILFLTLPPDGFSDPFDLQLAHSMVAAGRSGTPIEFVVASDVPTQRVIDALGAEVVQTQGAVPPAPAAPVDSPAFHPPLPPAAQRLQELETLRATGAITDAEYASKREKVISEL